MFKALIFPSKIEITRIVISILLLVLYVQPSIQLSVTEGQDAELTFPYPCDSTEVTIQYALRAPFYHLTLPQDQGQRLRVENRISDGNCFLDLMISGVIRSDEGTYISIVYKDGEILLDETHRIWLGIEYPPGKASCVEEEDKVGEWVSIECTADVGSLSGKFECYQNEELMPSLTNPVETQNMLMQSIIVRKMQPVFCCSSTLNENKGRCACNDAALYLPDDGIINPCPTSSTIIILPLTSETEYNHFCPFSTMASNVSTQIKQYNYKSVIVHLVLVPIEIILLVSMIVTSCVFYKLKMKTPNNKFKIMT